MLKQISAFIENRSGALADITDILSESGVDLRALFIAETSDYGVLRMIVDDCLKAQQALQNGGVIVDINDVIAVSVPDKPGGLAKLLRQMTDNGIDVNYMYSVFGNADKSAHMVLKVSDNAVLEKFLSDNGIKSETVDDLK